MLTIVRKIASKIRRELDKNEDGPAGKCFEYSLKLKEALEAANIPCSVTAGTFECDRPVFASSITPGHYWIELVEDKTSAERVIVDVTADQFETWCNYNIPKVLIGTYNEWKMYNYGAQ